VPDARTSLSPTSQETGVNAATFATAPAVAFVANVNVPIAVVFFETLHAEVEPLPATVATALMPITSIGVFTTIASRIAALRVPQEYNPKVILLCDP
jgi:hypothetical protein